MGATPFYIGSGFGKNGAGDITLCAAAGAGENDSAAQYARGALQLGILFAVLYGLYVLGNALIAQLRRRPSMRSCPLVPFLAAGFIPAYFFA